MEKRISKEMRLIDANQFEVMSWREQGGREYANGFDDGVDYVVQKIDKAKTIKAIPFEWLKKKYRENDPDSGNEDFDRYLWDSICYVLTAWEEEQGEEDLIAWKDELEDE